MQKVYEFYDALKTERDKLKDELKKHSDLPEEVLKAQKSGVPSAETIKSSLETIDWQKDKIKVQRNHQSDKFFNFRGWGNWNINPYRLFYGREPDWKSDINKLNLNVRELHKVEQTIVRLNSMGIVTWGWRAQKHIKEETEKAEKLKSKMYSHIELRVAHQLLRYMNSPKA